MKSRFLISGKESTPPIYLHVMGGEGISSIISRLGGGEILKKRPFSNKIFSPDLNFFYIY